MGLLVKEKLKKLKLKNGWLIDRLNLDGWNVYPEELSRFISGARKSERGDRMLAAAYDILCDYEKTERLKACY